jgi:hypothetical protein
LVVFGSTGVWTQGLLLKPHHQSFSLLFFFRLGLTFCLCQSRPQSSYFRMKRTYHCAQLFLLRWGLANFFAGWPRTVILQISASHVAGVTGVYHHIQLLVEIESHEFFAVVTMIRGWWSPPLG